MKTKDIKQKRLDIVLKIDQWEKHRCKTCAGSSTKTESIHCGCEAAVEIRKLGEEYNAIARESRKNRIRDLFNEAKANGLTLDLYRRLKEAELTNKEIQKGAGMTQRRFQEWKYENKLIAVSPDRASPTKRVVPAKYAKLAMENGISLHHLKKRVFVHEWDWQRAATKPLEVRKNDLKKWVPIAESNGICKSTLRNRLARGEEIETAATRPVHKQSKRKHSG